MYRILPTFILWASSAAAATLTVPGDFPTIQAALDGAPDGSTVQVAPGTYHEVLKVDRLTHQLTIRGNPTAPEGTIVDGDGVADATLTVLSSGGGLAFEGLTFTGGRGGPGIGGGLFMADSQTVFSHCVFRNNSSDPDGGGGFILSGGGLFRDCEFRDNSAARFGGGLMVNAGATTVFEQCRFIDNTAGTSSDVEGWGGGLHINDSSPTLIGCTIEGNHAKFAAGGLSVTGHFSEPESVILLRDTRIANNVVIQARPDLAPSEGGGMHIEDNVRAFLDRCRVVGNTSNTGGGLNSYRGHYVITDSIIANNQATPVEPEVGGFGGGIYAQSVNTSQPTRQAATIELRNSVVRGNTGHVGAGVFAQGDFFGLSSNRASVEVIDSIIAGNTASGRGAGFFLDRADATITTSLIVENEVSALNNSWGGGIAVVASSSATLVDVSLIGNTVRELGGALYVDQASTIAVQGSRLMNNSAGSGNGVGGGAIAVGQAPGPNGGPSTGSIRDSTLAANGDTYEIWESDCDPSRTSTILYRDNTIDPTPGTGPYFTNCNVLGVPTVAAFNLRAGKASNNVDAPPHFSVFLGAPRTIVAGQESLLAWATTDGLAAEISGVMSLPTPVGVAAVAPVATTTYELIEGASTTASSTITVTCGDLGTPVALAPSHDASGTIARDVLLQWSAAERATAYDVYLDTVTPPVTLATADTAATSYAPPSLADGTTYYWRVVAKNPACATPAAGPIVRFSTCNGTVCYDETFDRDVSASWPLSSGKGTVTVENGNLILRARKKLVTVSPVGDITDGDVAARITMVRGRGKREFRIVLRRADAANYTVATLRLPNKVRIDQVVDNQTRRVGLARATIPVEQAFDLGIALAGNRVDMALDGQSIGSIDGLTPRAGGLAFSVPRGAVRIDSVHVEGRP
jgi:hypothetical protein